MRVMRAPGAGWLMISVANMFIRKMLPDLTYAKLSPEALAYYASAFPTIASRKAIRQWPREVPPVGSEHSFTPRSGTTATATNGTRPASL